MLSVCSWASCTPQCSLSDSHSVLFPLHCRFRMECNLVAGHPWTPGPAPAHLFILPTHPCQPPAILNHFCLYSCCSHCPEHLPCVLLSPPPHTLSGKLVQLLPNPRKGHLSEALPECLSQEPLTDEEAPSPDLPTESTELLLVTADDHGGCTCLTCLVPLVLTATL